MLKKASVVLAIAAVLMLLLTAITPFTILAAPPDDKPKEEVKITTKYPALSSVAGSTYEFEVEILYTGGDKPKTFDLRTSVPKGFVSQITKSYGTGANLAAVQLDPDKAYPEAIKILVTPYYWLVPEPGDYKITFEAISGTLKGSIDLKAVVTARYDLKLETPEGLLNTKVTAGKDNYFSYKVINKGTAPLEKINFNHNVRGGPSGWSVTFDPKTIDSLPVNGEREVQVTIKPPEKTIAGDYQITMRAATESNNASDTLDIRVTVLTPTIWGWVGIIIVVIVVIGLIAMFWRLGRR